MVHEPVPPKSDLEVTKALFNSWASYLWDKIYSFRQHINGNPDQLPPEDWTADREWLKEDTLKDFKAVVSRLEKAKVIDILGPYADVVAAETDEKSTPADFRQDIIDLWNAWYEITIEILPRMEFIVNGSEQADGDRAALRLEKAPTLPRQHRQPEYRQRNAPSLLAS